MTETDLLMKLSKQVEQRRQIVKMLEEELKNMNQVLSDFVFLHKKISLLEMEEDVTDCQSQSRYLLLLLAGWPDIMNVSEWAVWSVRCWAVSQ